MFSQSQDLTNAVQVLRDGGIIAYPTDTIVGLGCLPAHVTTITRLAHLKDRPITKSGFILLASQLSQLSPYIECDEQIQKKIELPLAQPTTWIVQARPELPTADEVHCTQGIRITDHPWIVALCEQVGAIISTSANLSGSSNARSFQEIRTYFGPLIDYYSQQPLTYGTGKPSRIENLISGKTLRP